MLSHFLEALARLLEYNKINKHLSETSITISNLKRVQILILDTFWIKLESYQFLSGEAFNFDHLYTSSFRYCVDILVPLPLITEALHY